MLVLSFSYEINGALNNKTDSLAELESEVVCLEKSYEDEAKVFEDDSRLIRTCFIVDAKDGVLLNVSGTIMATKRATSEGVVAR